MSYGGRLFDYDEAAAAIHFAYQPETIRRMCEDGVLRRGEHWIIRTYVLGAIHSRWRVRFLNQNGIRALFDRLSGRIESPHGRRARTRANTTSTHDAT